MLYVIMDHSGRWVIDEVVGAMKGVTCFEWGIGGGWVGGKILAPPPWDWHRVPVFTVF